LKKKILEVKKLITLIKKIYSEINEKRREKKRKEEKK